MGKEEHDTSVSACPDGSADRCKNLELILDIARKEYESELARFRNHDNKLNMLLVLWAAIFAGIILIASEWGFVGFFQYAFLSILLCMSAAFVLIIIGLYPKGYAILQGSDLAVEDRYALKHTDLLELVIDAYVNCARSITHSNKRKSFFIQFSIILIGIALAIIAISLLFLVIGGQI